MSDAVGEWSMLTYTEAMTEALDRLRGVGYEHGTAFANHAPMAAEALASLGYTDEVPGWVEANLRSRRYHERPEPRWPLSADDEADWLSALGDFGRVADWSAMFERELRARPWGEVLRRWWPRLLPGMSGMLAHSVIRTAHAVRSLAGAGADDRAQRRELADGLGYWAARYVGDKPPSETCQEWSRTPGPDPTDPVFAAFDELIADAAGHYVQARHGHPVPLIHAITTPAAIRLVCQHLPVELLRPSYVAAREASAWMRSYFGSLSRMANSHPGAEPAGVTDLVAEAVDLGDEHAIKLAEVAVRQSVLVPDDRYAAASRAATWRLRRCPPR
jgi:hypothetical protein